MGKPEMCIYNIIWRLIKGRVTGITCAEGKVSWPRLTPTQHNTINRDRRVGVSMRAKFEQRVFITLARH